MLSLVPVGFRPGIAVRCCIFVTVVAISAPELIQAQDYSRFSRWFYEDAADLISSMDQRTPVVVIGISAAVASLTPADPRILDSVQQRYEGSFGSFLNVTNHLGDRKIRYPAYSVFALSLMTENERLQDAAFTSAQSILYAGVITSTLKAVIGRTRPESTYDSQAFTPFSGNRSFPSGHTTAAFAVVTPWVLYYPGPITYTLFALSTGTAVARIAKDKHWPTDVIAGAAVGYLTARYLARRHMDEQGFRRPNFHVAPAISTRSAGIALHFRIG